MPKCKKCGAEIDFIKTPVGRLMPIDVAPPENKRRVTVETSEGPKQVVPHWATCPYAHEFRR